MSKHLEIVKDVGRMGLNLLYPNDFEYYLIIMELVDSEGRTVEYLSFPVNPESISYDDELLTNVKKTLGGVVATDIGTNRPKRISLTGTFGRKLRLLVDVDSPCDNSNTKSGVFSMTPNNGLEIKTNIFNARLKTGYGTTKILKAIVDKSVQLDEYNQPYKLYLYFPPLGESYLVKFQNFKLNQDYSTSNMLWKYNMTLTVLGELKDMLGSESSSVSQLKLPAIQKGINLLFNKINSYL